MCEYLLRVYLYFGSGFNGSVYCILAWVWLSNYCFSSLFIWYMPVRDQMGPSIKASQSVCADEQVAVGKEEIKIPGCTLSPVSCPLQLSLSSG